MKSNWSLTNYYNWWCNWAKLKSLVMYLVIDLKEKKQLHISKQDPYPISNRPTSQKSGSVHLSLIYLKSSTKPSCLLRRSFSWVQWKGKSISCALSSVRSSSMTCPHMIPDGLSLTRKESPSTPIWSLVISSKASSDSMSTFWRFWSSFAFGQK